MKRILILLPFLTACATSSEYTAYLQAQQEANKQAAEHQATLVFNSSNLTPAIAGCSVSNTIV